MNNFFIFFDCYKDYFNVLILENQELRSPVLIIPFEEKLIIIIEIVVIMT